jgi:predicted CXXCH cytochrome family protein
MKARTTSVWLAAPMLLFMAQVAMAAGPHDENCVSCHNVHYAKGNFIIGPQPNTTLDNPAANAKISGIESLCLGCHNEAEGIMPIHLTTTHPTGVAPTYVKVPERLLRDGKLSCVSCHNPHPSNTNYKYLVVDTQNGSNMGVFCATCHTEQAPADVRKASQGSAINSDPNVLPRVQVQPQPAAAAPTPKPKSAKAAK